MTYCVGLFLDEGLVMASDSRTNAGVDYITSYTKMHVFTPAPDRIFVLMSAGNLATTQELLNRIRRDLDNNAGPNLMTVRYLWEAADYIGQLSLEVQQHHGVALQQSGVSGDVSLILGGQIQGQPHGLMMIYPQGNYIEASAETPYLQIGEAKYGKPVLDRVGRYDMPLEEAGRLVLVSLSSTAMSNITVGTPFDLGMYRRDMFQLSRQCRFDDKEGYLNVLDAAWRKGLEEVFHNLPKFEWELDGNVNSGDCVVAVAPAAEPVARPPQSQSQAQADIGIAPQVPNWPTR
ncbi:MAG: 20S proteasome subunit A/B [Gammaproteobacteria bacterium]|nr:20S proteasome subunit A/B [Gammaproteobacteria bacterium]MCP5137874.1 20S proteasome subunit A/B [Gammaproteobacteria bacterium]